MAAPARISLFNSFVTKVPIEKVAAVEKAETISEIFGADVYEFLRFSLAFFYF
jgi:hypothetical protein